MIFNSLGFAVFFPLVTLGYFILPGRIRNAWLLLASCVFYMWFIPKYILVLGLTIAIDYFAGSFIEDAGPASRKAWLYASILSTCLVLFAFKYFNFFNENIAALAKFLHWQYSVGSLRLLLPVGLSFHTFQSLSYVIEVYRGRQRAERNFLTYALYVMFYPQLVAGPIERPQNLLHQFYEDHPFDASRVAMGLKRMAWGFFKKLVIADRFAPFVTQGFGHPQNASGPTLAIASIFFAFQIYCDFSGYSDIALGAAGVMGFRLMENFRHPYFAASVADFWQRWHISLSTWFKDYLYIPLGGRRVSKWRWKLNLLITFIVSGLWHGANWTYLAWGALNGVYLIFALSAAPWCRVFPRIINIVLTFFLITFSWIFFRAQSLRDAFYIVRKLPSGWGHPARALGQNHRWFLISLGLLGFLLLVEMGEGETNRIWQMVSDRPFWLRWLCYYAIIFIILTLGVFGENQFIYFQF